MKSARLIVLVGSLSFLASLPAASMEKDDPLLDQSYNLSRTLGGQERLFYLIELCRVSTLLKPPAAQAHEWCRTLYSVASTEQDLRLRTVAQKNAVTYLSYLDPAMAMELLSQISFERPRPGAMAYEDPRYNAAETTFINFLTMLKPQDLSSIALKARYLGQTGQYPYRAIAGVIQRVPKSLQDQANGLVRDAMGFYANETGFYNRDEEFLVLLRSLRNAPVDRGITVQALTMFVQRLQNDPVHLPGDYYAEVHIVSSGTVLPFTDRNQAFLFQAFPTVRHFDGALAAELSQQDPNLDRATDDMRYISGGFVQGDPTSEQADRQHLQWLQQSLVSRIKERKDCNPEAGARLAQRLTGADSRVTGFSAIIPAMVRSNPTRARKIYEEQLSEIANLDDSIGKLRAISALAPAAYAIGDSKQYHYLAAQAFAIGTRFFRADLKAGRAQNHQGFAELMDLVTFAASHSPDPLQARVQHLPNDWLKAYLWLYEADGHAKLNARTAVPAVCPN